MLTTAGGNFECQRKARMERREERAVATDRYELLVCPRCGHRWLTIGAAALSEDEAQGLVDDHLARSHMGERIELEAFVPLTQKKPRPPSNRSEG